MTRQMKQRIDFAKKIATGIFLMFLTLLYFYPQFALLIPIRWRPFG